MIYFLYLWTCGKYLSARLHPNCCFSLNNAACTLNRLLNGGEFLSGEFISLASGSIVPAWEPWVNLLVSTEQCTKYFAENLEKQGVCPCENLYGVKSRVINEIFVGVRTKGNAGLAFSLNAGLICCLQRVTYASYEKKGCPYYCGKPGNWRFHSPD